MKQLGDKFNAPVKVQSGQGYTYNTDGSAFALNAAIALQMENALVPAFSLLRRDNISYTAISRSAGKNSFGKAVDITLVIGVTKVGKNGKSPLTNGQFRVKHKCNSLCQCRE